MRMRTGSARCRMPQRPIFSTTHRMGSLPCAQCLIRNLPRLRGEQMFNQGVWLWYDKSGKPNTKKGDGNPVEEKQMS
eukprot:CCRYP_004860-RA/>CCRYP_004860-RA protein AED:0.43 eAED:0.58 QI:222/0/0.5/1/0/0/2/0/76